MGQLPSPNRSCITQSQKAFIAKQRLVTIFMSITTVQHSVAPGFPFGGGASLRYKIRMPRGNWLGERTFFDAGIKNSYPSLVEVSPCDFRAVWDSGTAEKARTHIRFAKFKIEP